MFSVILVTWVLHLTSSRAQEQNPPCSPRLTVLPIDAPYYRLYPYFVELHRCVGACSVTPAIQHCSGKTFTEFTLNAVNTVTIKHQTITLKNHTSCDCSCVKKASDCDHELERWDEDRCNCACKYRLSPPVPCDDNLEWDGSLCKCICNRPPELCTGNNQEWNEEACGCVCQERVVKRCARKQKFLDHEKCECVVSLPKVPDTGGRTGSDGLDRRMFIGALVVEFLLLVIAFDLFLYCKFNWRGVVYFIHRKCCPRQKDKERNGPQLDTASQEDSHTPWRVRYNSTFTKARKKPARPPGAAEEHNSVEHLPSQGKSQEGSQAPSKCTI